MSKAFAILIAVAISLQSLLGGVAAAGTICLGGGHEHPAEASSKSCSLDCSHASSETSLPTLVDEPHDGCGCVDLDLSITEFVTTLPRYEALTAEGALLSPLAQSVLPPAQWSSRPTLSPVPKWFDPGDARHLAVLSTSRLNL
ncbi:MAG: hypothetical protein AB8C95_10025 [Phycisphaeraceae bacterium]